MPDETFTAIGWTPDWEEAFRPHAAAGLVPGRVSLEHNHVYRVMTAAGEVLAETAGRLKHRAAGREELPAVGDWVALRIEPSDGRGVIKVILPRRSRFSRKAPGRETVEQVLAANIDTVFLVSALDQPVSRGRIERYLLLAKSSGARPVVILNKSDLSDNVSAAIEEVRGAAPDVDVLAISAKQPDSLAPLRRYLGVGQTVALLGPSGAGKSSIVNALAGRQSQATAEVRPSDRRGRHTSVHRELIVLDDGGVVIDTPGLRELQLWSAEDAEDVSLDETFAEIAALAPDCRFRNCRHDTEPGCRVKAAVESGGLAASRHAGYLKLQAEQEALVKRHDERALLDAKRQTKAATRSLNASQKRRDH